MHTASGTSDIPDTLEIRDGSYLTAEAEVRAFARAFPSLAFYPRLVAIVINASREARAGLYDTERWRCSSLAVLRALEAVGVKFDVSGFDNLEKFDGPVVFVSNHMSTLETFCLPALLVPFKSTTFIVKQSLMEFPVLKHVIRARDPIGVTRTNPREDLRKVITEGLSKLNAGMSLVVFPQTTRVTVFKPEGFNSLGAKLARRAGVPVVPMALKTDAWATGSLLKDFGPIVPSLPAYIKIGPPMEVTGNGSEEHRRTIEFIRRNLVAWGGRVAE